MMLPKFIRKILSFRYPVHTLIHEKRADISMIRTDRVRRVRDKKSQTDTYHFCYSGEIIQPPKLDYVYNGNWMLLYSPDRGVYYPAIFTENPKEIQVEKINPATGKTEIVTTTLEEIKPIRQEQRYFLAKQIEESWIKWNKQKTFWDKAYPVIILLLMIVGAFLILNQVVSGLDSVSKTMAGTPDSFAKAFQQICMNASKINTTGNVIAW